MRLTKKKRRTKIKSRVCKKISGVSDRPRISIFKSNKEIYAQIIDDTKGITLVSASSKEKGISIDKTTKMIVAAEIGKRLAQKAKQAGIEQVVFDRNGYLYHGRVKSLAEGAREMGLKF
ncbi:MAG: 50S ribosomal protein L18 [Flavobacteriales bacterium AspAUS03]